MKTKIDSYILSCDNCNDIYENRSGYTGFPDEQTMIDDASDDEWNIGEKHYCDECWSYDINDKIIVNPDRTVEPAKKQEGQG